MTMSVQKIADLLDGKVIGDGTVQISGVTNIESPLAGHITFLENGKWLNKLESSPIACLIVAPEITRSQKPLIQVPLPKLAWAKLIQEFYPMPAFSGKVSPLAFVADGAKLGGNVTVEAFAYISDGADIGDDAVIQSHAFVGNNVKIGQRTVLHPGVKIYRDCRIGSEVVLHAGTVIGADGFGYVSTAQGHTKVPQVGNVVIGDNVEIGALACVDRATIGSTMIGTGCKIDNLVQIAHNVQIGPHTVISAQTGISGSCKIGAHVTMGGKVGLGDHVEIGDGTMVGAGAGFPSGKKVPPKQIVFGEPARPYAEARRQIAAQLRSAEMYDEIKVLRKRMEALEKLIATDSPKISP